MSLLLAGLFARFFSPWLQKSTEVLRDHIHATEGIYDKLEELYVKEWESFPLLLRSKVTILLISHSRLFQ